ncbi:MAG: GNAT family N-acetyltransferase [Anaerolineaceae bacterium]|nr:GNAT family N-acetyltransferase [Anaerolineaceae bacterium]
MFSIRPFQPTDAEYEAIAAVEKAVYPENADTVADFKHADASREPEQFFQRWVVAENGRILAFAQLQQQIHSSTSGHYRFHITVHPDFERRGVGTAVYNQIWQTLQTQDPHPAVLDAHCYQHHQQAVRFLEKRGFRQVMRWVITRMELPKFDITPFEPLISKRQTQGISFVTLPQLQQLNENWLEALHELDWQLVQDEPLPYTPKKMPQEQFKKMFIESPNVLPDGWMIALENGQTIGNSNLDKGPMPGGLSTGFTGVMRDYRRRGLATALKALSLNWAKQAGYQFIRTGNEEHNPMLTLNKKLGFQEVTASLAFEKSVTP